MCHDQKKGVTVENDFGSTIVYSVKQTDTLVEQKRANFSKCGASLYRKWQFRVYKQGKNPWQIWNTTKIVQSNFLCQSNLVS